LRCIALLTKFWFSDFDLSDAQQEHALAVEHLVPELAALRSEICLGYMSEASFWKIYFVLVHPRLSKHDALILSTPEVSCLFNVNINIWMLITSSPIFLCCVET